MSSKQTGAETTSQKTRAQALLLCSKATVQLKPPHHPVAPAASPPPNARREVANHSDPDNPVSLYPLQPTCRNIASASCHVTDPASRSSSRHQLATADLGQRIWEVSSLPSGTMKQTFPRSCRFRFPFEPWATLDTNAGGGSIFDPVSSAL